MTLSLEILCGKNSDNYNLYAQNIAIANFISQNQGQNSHSRCNKNHRVTDSYDASIMQVLS